MPLEIDFFCPVLSRPFINSQKMTDVLNSALAPTRARHKVSSQSKNTKWTQEEDEALQKLVDSRFSTNWPDYCPYLPGKSAQQIAERWDKVLNPCLIKGSWTREEDEIIVQFVKENGVKNWTKLAQLLPGRIGKQCRERWRNHLDPDVNREPWTPEEDQILIEMHESIGNQWVKIAERLSGRSYNAVKNRWNSTLKKRLEYEKNGTPRPKRGRPSHKNKPKSADDVPKPPRFTDSTTIPLAPTFTTPTMMSPFTLKSPFSLFSPGLKEMAGWSPSGRTDLENIDYSPQLFSPSLGDHKDEMMSLLSPMMRK